MELERFQKCRAFLGPWLGFLEVEALKHYPNHLPGELAHWSQSLEKLSIEQLWKFQNDFDLSEIDSSSLKEFVVSIQGLTSFEKVQTNGSRLPKRLLRKITPKKEHEIRSMIGLAGQFRQVDAVLDVGGGVGHLSCALVNGKNRRSFCVDANPELQAAGKKRLEKWNREALEKIEFVHRLVDGDLDFREFERCQNRLVVGLHSCGCLGTHLVKGVACKGYEHFLLASCCYHKLDGAYNISDAAKDGIAFSPNALHLAARCHRHESLEEFQNKLMLRRYRYGLHLFEYERGNTQFAAIGNTKLSDYQGSFMNYVKKYSSLPANEREMESFYHSDTTQARIRQIIISDIVRALLGRVVETYLVLDRALYLIERGFGAKVVEAFERRLSPRNLVVMATNGQRSLNSFGEPETEEEV